VEHTPAATRTPHNPDATLVCPINGGEVDTSKRMTKIAAEVNGVALGMGSPNPDLSDATMADPFVSHRR
jgi:hypothetical protein